MKPILAAAWAAVVVAMAVAAPAHPAAAAEIAVAPAAYEASVSDSLPVPFASSTPAPAVARVQPVARAAVVALPAGGPATVLASYFGPGLYGRRTACGQTLTTELLGVAHRSLPCGTPVTLAHGSATVTVPVVDRGPYNYAREFDLTYAAKAALGCGDLCTLTWIR